MRLLRWSLILLAASGLLACASRRLESPRPVPTALLPSNDGSHRLVVVLPGRRDRLESLRRSGVGEAIQRVWPDADVLFAELLMPYYLDRSAARRLHDEVLLPARRRAYSEIWLVGASLGGMGCLLYDRMYPGQVDGMVLLAPTRASARSTTRSAPRAACAHGRRPVATTRTPGSASCGRT